MNTLILDGRKVRDARVPSLKAEIAGLFRKPRLAIIQVGKREDSTSFIRAKTTFANKIGVEVSHILLPEDTTEDMVINKIRECNEDETISGIIVQLPLPIAIDQDRVIESIDSHKDVDALTSRNVKMWLEGREDALWPATSRGIRELLLYYEIDLFGKHVVVVGRSMLVGKPLVALSLALNASVTVCHSRTTNLPEKTMAADVIFVAAGKPGLITQKHIKDGAVVIDVGINTSADKKITGDVDFINVSKKAAAITPVPGGVGPMTVLGLFENLLDLCRSK